MSQPNFIEARHLTHRYGAQKIYEDLNLAIPPGKIYGLLGKNGAGKTTLIKILMGFLRPVSGCCKVFGEDSHNLSPAARSRIGLLFEGHVTYEFMSIAHVKRVDNAPQVVRTPIDPALRTRHIKVSENRRRETCGLLLAGDGRLFVPTCDNYRPVPLDLAGYDPDRMDVKLIFKPFWPGRLIFPRLNRQAR